MNLRRFNVRVAGGCALILTLALMVVSFLGCTNNHDNPSSPLPPATAPIAPVQLKPGIFEDVTSTSGIIFTHRNHQEAGNLAILESLGGGLALIDYDQDGLLDIFITGGGLIDGKE